MIKNKEESSNESKKDYLTVVCNESDFNFGNEDFTVYIDFKSNTINIEKLFNNIK